MRIDGLSQGQEMELARIADKMRFENATNANAACGSIGGGEKATDSSRNQGMQVQVGSARPSDEVTLENVDEVMRYQSWGPDQVQAGDIVREALTAGVRAILRVVPRCPNRTKAINHIIDARMDANAGISFRGRF